MLEMQIIGREISSVEELHEKFERELELPDYYGANLDALYDVLTEMGEETSIEFSLKGMEEGPLKSYMEKVWRVLCDAADENLYLEIKRTEE